MVMAGKPGNGGNSNKGERDAPWLVEAWDSQLEAFVMFLLFEVYNVVMVIFSPVIWPAYGIFIAITLFDWDTYWKQGSGSDGKKSGGLSLFSHIPYVYWFMFAKFYLIDYALQILNSLGGKKYSDNDRNKAYNVNSMQLITFWWLMYPVNLIMSPLNFLFGFIAWPSIASVEFLITIFNPNA